MRIGDGVVVSVSVPYSVLLCAIVRLFYFNFVVSTFETRVSTSLNVIALLVNISTVWFNSLWIFQRGGHNSQVAADWLASRVLHNFIINGFTLSFSGYELAFSNGAFAVEYCASFPFVFLLNPPTSPRVRSCECECIHEVSSFLSLSPTCDPANAQQ